MSAVQSGNWAAQKMRRIEVFWDTMDFCETNRTLFDAVRKSCRDTRLYAADDYPALPQAADAPAAAAEVRVTRKRTFESAMCLVREFPGKKVGVLNFASSIQPGGGVKNGSSAQEECLCRCSTLFPVLDQERLLDSYYSVNRAARNVMHTDDCIYSPGILICKTDEDVPQRLPAEQFTSVDVISCAAPNLSREPSNRHNPETGEPVHADAETLFAIHVRRARHILHVAAVNGVRILVLGAFGCGAFENDPQIVARAFHEALADYRTRFDVIEFAVYCRGNNTRNYDAFRQEIQ